MGNNEQEPRGYWVPTNVLQGKRILNIRLRNVIEAGIWVVIVFFLVSFIPFVTRVRIIVTVCLAIAVAGVNLMGVKDMSLSEVVLNFIHYHVHGHKYHLRSIDNAEEKKDNNGKIATQASENLAQRIIGTVKERIDEFLEDDEWDEGEAPEEES